MLPFLHHRLQLLHRQLERSNAVLVKYTQYDLDLAVALTGFLDEAIALYRTLNQTSAENELLALKAQFVSAEGGTHPLTLERVTSHRRDMVRLIALHVLQQSALKLRTDAERVTHKLDEGQTQLRPIALLAIQKGLISQHGPTGQSLIEAIWSRLLDDPEIQLAARQVAMQLSVFDIHLLLSDLIDAAQQAPPDHAPSAWAPANGAEPREQSEGRPCALAAVPPDGSPRQTDSAAG
jgi:hypothetical protein